MTGSIIYLLSGPGSCNMDRSFDFSISWFLSELLGIFWIVCNKLYQILEWFFQNKLSTQWPYGMFPDGHVERSTELQNFRHEMSHRHFCTPFGNTHRSHGSFHVWAHPSKFHELFVAGLVTLCLQHYGPRDFCIDRGKSVCTIEMPMQKNPYTTFPRFFPARDLLDLEQRTFQ